MALGSRYACLWCAKARFWQRSLTVARILFSAGMAGGSVLDPEDSFIQCALHGALFRLEDDYCLQGPCAGQSLKPIEFGLIDGRLWARLQEPWSD